MCILPLVLYTALLPGWEAEVKETVEVKGTTGVQGNASSPAGARGVLAKIPLFQRRRKRHERGT